jgi:hypothetical protein
MMIIKNCLLYTYDIYNSAVEDEQGGVIDVKGEYTASTSIVTKIDFDDSGVGFDITEPGQFKFGEATLKINNWAGKIKFIGSLLSYTLSDGTHTVEYPKLIDIKCDALCEFEKNLKTLQGQPADSSPQKKSIGTPLKADPIPPSKTTPSAN